MGIVAEFFLPLALAFIMFALGLGLTFDDFARVAKQPKDFVVGAASQLILLPVAAFVLVSIWSMNPEIALGVMIIAAAPGGVTSNILTAFARGDVALSISLTAVISLVCVITIPLIVVFAHGQLIGGDVLFAGSIGRTDLPGGDHATLIKSIREKLLPLGDDVAFLPGHGQASTIGHERETNPFLT